MERLKLLVEATLEATSDDQAYQALAGRLALAMGASFANIAEKNSDGAVIISSAHEIIEEVSAYENHFYKHDLWKRAVVDADLQHLAVNLDDLLPVRAFENSEFYNDFIKPSGKDAFHCIGMLLPVPHGAGLTSIGIQRDRRQGRFDASDVRVLQAAQPVLARMASERWRRRFLAESLLMIEIEANSAPDAVMVINRSRQALWRNDTAARMPDFAPIAIGTDGIVRCKRSLENKAFQQAVIAATGSFPVGSSLSMGDIGDHPLWRVSIEPSRQQPEKHLAIVRLRDMMAHAARQSIAAAQAFGLTPAEANLAEGLLRGLSLEACAAARGVGMPTVRAQISAILSKSGTDRQAAFVALAGALPR